MYVPTAVLSPIGRMAAVASVAALMVSAVEPSKADAASPQASPAGPAAATAKGQGNATDFSARRRGYGGAAAAAAFAGVVGTGLAIAAAQNRAAYGYYDGYGGPAYYGGGPVYYGGGPYHYGIGPNYPYQRYGGTSPYEYCGQGSMTNCW